MPATRATRAAWGVGGLTITPNATLSLANLNFTYDGSAHAATVATGPANLARAAVTYTQGGAAVSRPTRAGSYTVTASLSNAQYVATSVTGTLVIGRAIPIITWPSPAAIVSGRQAGLDPVRRHRQRPGLVRLRTVRRDDAESGTRVRRSR